MKNAILKKKHILKLKDEYLNTNTINKYKEDKGYRDKIDQIKSFLDKYKTSGYILDIGSNTSESRKYYITLVIIWLHLI